MLIRTAHAEDVAALADFARWTYARAFGDSMSAGDLEHHLTHRLSDTYFSDTMREDTFLVAIDPALVGYAQIGAADVEGAAPGDEQLRRLYVHPERQNGGIGTALMKAALAHPRLGGARGIYLDVWEKNSGARRLYERFGFRVVGEHPFVTASGAVSGSDLLMLRRPS